MPHSITGRGVKSPTLEIASDASGVTLRVDDDERPEFWLSVWISREQLVDMLADCDLAHVEQCGRIVS